MENFDFLKLGEVPEVDKLLDTDTVLAVRDGEVYRVPKGQVGGAGGYLIVPEGDEIVQVSSSEYYITTPCQEAFDVIRAGGNVTIAMNAGLLGEEFADLGLCYMSVHFTIIADGSLIGVSGEIAMVGIDFFGDEVMFALTNGQALPTEASVATLSLDGETAPASLLEKLRSKLGGGANAVV